jgi:hypothetical protein
MSGRKKACERERACESMFVEIEHERERERKREMCDRL